MAQDRISPRRPSRTPRTLTGLLSVTLLVAPPPLKCLQSGFSIAASGREGYLDKTASCETARSGSRVPTPPRCGSRRTCGVVGWGARRAEISVALPTEGDNRSRLRLIRGTAFTVLSRARAREDLLPPSIALAESAQREALRPVGKSPRRPPTRSLRACA
jgi:hypothetical protein